MPATTARRLVALSRAVLAATPGPPPVCLDDVPAVPPGPHVDPRTERVARAAKCLREELALVLVGRAGSPALLADEAANVERLLVRLGLG